MKLALFYIACVVLIVVPPIFMVYRAYNDRLFGRAALIGMTLAAWAFMLSVADDKNPDPPPQAVLLVCSFAVFLVWHLYHFHRRVQKTGCPPGCPHDRRDGPRDRRFA